MEARALSILLALLIVYACGSLLIEFRARYLRQQEPPPRVVRRRTGRIPELEPLGEGILREAEEMLDKERLQTRDGLKFIMRMMSELYLAEARRTLKVNDLVELCNELAVRLEVIRHKNLISWIEDHPKLAYLLALLVLALIVDEIRLPIVRLLMNKIGLVIP